MKVAIQLDECGLGRLMTEKKDGALDPLAERMLSDLIKVDFSFRY